MASSTSFPLFVGAGTDAVPDRPALIGGRCVCGHVFFPMQTYGCEKCGRHGDHLRELRLSGCGRLLAFARVHIHARPYPKVPFTVVVVRLDEGPVIRALLDPAVGGDLRDGAGMVAKLVQEQSEGHSRKVLRFTHADHEET
jgi:uncharacterized protein